MMCCRDVGADSSDDEVWKPKAATHSVGKTNRMKIKTKFVSSDRKMSKSRAKARQPRCGTCSGCTAVNCKICTFCLDMKKYGGPGKMKQCCM